MADTLYSNQQTSRRGKAAITIFLKPEAKAAIRATLADGGYGISYQEDIANLLNELFKQRHRSTHLQALATKKPISDGSAACF